MVATALFSTLEGGLSLTYRILLGLLCIVSSAISSSQTVLRVDDRAAHHLAAGQQYGKLRRLIESALYVDKGEEELEQFLHDIVNHIESINIDSPVIPRHILDETTHEAAISEGRDYQKALTAEESIIETLRDYGQVPIGFLSKSQNLSHIKTLEILEALRAKSIVDIQGGNVSLKEAKQTQ